MNDMHGIQATNMVQRSNVDNEKTIVHSIEGEEVFGIAQQRELCNFLGQQKIIIIWFTQKVPSLISTCIKIGF